MTVFNCVRSVLLQVPAQEAVHKCTGSVPSYFSLVVQSLVQVQWSMTCDKAAPHLHDRLIEVRRQWCLILTDRTTASL